METEFVHHQSAHCESGVTSNLFKNAGVDLSEAMSFGIGSGLFFIHVPFAKIMGIPLTSFRSFPGGIFKRCCQRLGIPYSYHSYRNALKGIRALDQFLDDGRPVGVRGNIFWLPYIPEQFRFQFNAHNFVVYGKLPDGSYQVSDPILQEKSICPSSSMTKARFSRGPLSPKGLIFYPERTESPTKESLRQAIQKGIGETTNRMLFTPLPFAGVRGIHYLAKRMRKWPRKLDNPTLKLYVANVVRMQEEIGTGGAGFRYLYAAFLQESGRLMNDPVLLEAAAQMNRAGDLWREFATRAAKFCKDRWDGPYEEIPAILDQIAEAEKSIFQMLRREFLSSQRALSGTGESARVNS